MKTNHHVDGTGTGVERELDLEVAPEHKFDPVAFNAAIARWRGFSTERIKRLGFNSTDEFIDAVRGR